MAIFTRTGKADDDIIGIVRYTKQRWGEAQAARYYLAIDAACQALARGELRGELVPPLQLQIRKLRCRHHYIFYVEQEHLTILAVLHEKMDYLARLSRRLKQ